MGGEMKRKGDKEEIEEMERDFENIWDRAERVEIVTPPQGKRKSILSLRLDPETLRDLEIYARKNGLKPTVVARELIREGLARGGIKLSPKALLEMLDQRISG